MYSELFRIPLRVGGLPLFDGLLILAWLAICGIGMHTSIRHDGWRRAVVGHFPTVVLGVALLIFLPRYFPDGVPVRGYGVMLVAGISAAIALAMLRASQIGLDQDEILRLAVVMFVGGIFGGRAFYVVEYWGDQFQVVDTATGQTNWSASLLRTLRFTEGGLVVYGAFLGAMAALLIQVYRRNLPALATADLIAPSLAVGLAIGRIGCLLNGCCYGGETDLPWAVTFPHSAANGRLSPPYADHARSGRLHGLRFSDTTAESGGVRIDQVEADSPAAKAGLTSAHSIHAIDGVSVKSASEAGDVLLRSIVAANGDSARNSVRLRLDDGDVRTIINYAPPSRSLPIHPTQIYSAVNGFLLTWFLWSYYPWRRNDGEVVAAMLMLYSVARFLLEDIRVDENAVFGTGLSISQNVSVAAFTVGLAIWIWRKFARPGGESTMA